MISLQLFAFVSICVTATAVQIRLKFRTSFTALEKIQLKYWTAFQQPRHSCELLTDDALKTPLFSASTQKQIVTVANFT